SRLATARLKLRVAEAEGSADVAREHLGKLTGLPASSIESVAESIPSFPAVTQDESVRTAAEASNPAVQSAVEHARAQYLRAKASKNQVSEDTLKLQRAVRQMEAAEEVAQLEYEVAQSNLDAVQTRMDAGTATIKDLGESRAQASEHYIALQDTTFELARAHV